ncbi:PEP-CTERM sorting domain-containing protein [Roseateles sp. P5_E7]
MKIRNIRWSLMALGACAALLSTSAHAVWTFDQANVTGLAGTNAGDPAVSLSGVYAANTSGVVGGNWSAGALTWYSGNGQGMSTGTDGPQPTHALDNAGNTEAVLLNFGSSSVVLSSIGLGYTAKGNGCVTSAGAAATAECAAGTTLSYTTNVQVDVALFRWTGAAGTTPTGNPTALIGQGAAAMAGWELVGTYGDMVTDTNPAYNLVNSGQKTSSWWMISAYNTGFSSAAGETRGSLDNGNDYFKLYAVAGAKCTSSINAQGVCGGTTSKTPEPATLALTSVALLGVAGLRRRKAKIAA